MALVCKSLNETKYPASEDQQQKLFPCNAHGGNIVLFFYWLDGDF